MLGFFALAVEHTALHRLQILMSGLAAWAMNRSYLSNVSASTAARI
jgi:hypothetical protein